MPDVSDDLNQIWKQQTSLHGAKNSMYSTFNTGDKLWDDNKSTYKYSQINRRSNSGVPDENQNRTLKLAGKNTLTFPKRQRFNENTEETIKEMKNSASNARMTLSKVQDFDARS